MSFAQLLWLTFYKFILSWVNVNPGGPFLFSSLGGFGLTFATLVKILLRIMYWHKVNVPLLLDSKLSLLLGFKVTSGDNRSSSWSTSCI